MKRKAIKGLRAFGKEDAEIFTRLQRDRIPALLADTHARLQGKAVQRLSSS